MVTGVTNISLLGVTTVIGLGVWSPFLTSLKPHLYQALSKGQHTPPQCYSTNHSKIHLFTSLYPNSQPGFAVLSFPVPPWTLTLQSFSFSLHSGTLPIEVRIAHLHLTTASVLWVWGHMFRMW